MPIDSPSRLRAIYGEPNPLAIAKQLNRLDRHCLRFLELSPMMLIATTDGDRLDVSPKGGEPGFVKPDGDRAVLIPDWPGNNRIDGLLNIVARGKAGLIFLIPNVGETLRINGKATIHEEPEIKAPFLTRGKLPLTVLRVETEEVFVHCAKALARSSLWQPATWPARSALAPTSEIMRDHTRMPSEDETEEDKLKRYEKILY